MNIGPRIRIITRFTTLINIVAAIASVKGIPIMFAEKTFIASPIPRFPGVIATRIAKFEMADMNRAFVIPMSIPNMWYTIRY